MMTVTEGPEIIDQLFAGAPAELHGDVTALEEALTDDLVAVGSGAARSLGARLPSTGHIGSP
jgi:hypothetical protein